MMALLRRLGDFTQCSTALKHAKAVVHAKPSTRCSHVGPPSAAPITMGSTVIGQAPCWSGIHPLRARARNREGRRRPPLPPRPLSRAPEGAARRVELEAALRAEPDGVAWRALPRGSRASPWGAPLWADEAGAVPWAWGDVSFGAGAVPWRTEDGAPGPPALSDVLMGPSLPGCAVRWNTCALTR